MSDTQRMVRMEDIARQAGVTKATVSKALRNDPTISEKTRKRIVELAHACGYKRNALLGLHMSHVRASRQPDFRPVIAFVFFSPHTIRRQGAIHDFWEGADACCAALGYRLEVFYPIRDDLSFDALIRIFRTRDIRGLILGPQDPRHPVEDRRIQELCTPFATALLGFSFRSVPAHRASNHHFFSAFKAMTRLSELGYRSIGVAGYRITDRQLAYQLSGAVYAARIQSGKQKWIPPFFPADLNRDTLLRWNEQRKPDAILAIDKEILLWLGAAGIRIPDEVALASFSVQPDSRWAGIDQNSRLVGEAAAHLVIDQFHRNETGIPTHPREMLIHGDWVDGPSAPDRNPP